MDAWPNAYIGVAGVWAGAVLVGATDAFPALVYAMRSLPRGLAHANPALVSFSYAPSLLCYYDSGNCACPDCDVYSCCDAYPWGHARAVAYAYVHAYAGRVHYHHG
jgi:hypothetical protein